MKDDKILILQRGLNEKHDHGKWAVPGGKAEQTEGNGSFYFYCYRNLLFAVSFLKN